MHSKLQSQPKTANAFATVIGTIGGRTANKLGYAAALWSDPSRRARSAYNGTGASFDGLTT
jgi:hypothetical protein